jgi:molybdate transport system substrate-binding protein
MPKQAAECRYFLTAILLVAFSSCSNKDSRDSKSNSDTATQSKAARDNEVILVSAAASTKDIMEELAAKFSESTGAVVKINPGPSNTLARQIIEGAPADLFLSANQQWADEVKKSDNVHAVIRLLTNRLVLVVPMDNPGHVKKPQDLLSPDVRRAALAGEKVPAGIYAGQALTKLGLMDKPEMAGKIVRGEDVRLALMYVARGEAEAGIVYSTDAAADSGVQVVYEFDPSLHDEIAYVLVLLKHGSANPRAVDFFKFLKSADADSVYSTAGFSRLN